MVLSRRHDELLDKVARMRREWQAQRDALATVRRFNARLSAKRAAWFWPKIAAAIAAKHPWLVVACDGCGTVVDLDLRVKPRDAEASVRVALRDVRCPRCNGHGRPRIVALSRHPSLARRGRTGRPGRHGGRRKDRLAAVMGLELLVRRITAHSLEKSRQH
jgi:hypothetical protein